MLGASLVSPAVGQTSVLTQHNDNARTGQNTSETLLFPGNVNFNGFGKLFTQAVDGLIVGQPLVVPGLLFPDGSTHDVVYVATQHDGVFAFDANNKRGGNSAPLWSASFINPAAGITSVPISNYGCTGTGFSEVGITSTPVIDPASSTLYVVAKTLEISSYVFRLHALDLVTGQEKFSGPVVIAASAGSVTFNPTFQMQRPGLLLSNGIIYVGFGGNGCDTFQYYGWLLAYDAQSLNKLGTFLTTPKGRGGSIWQSGGGIAADDNGNIYFSTANGLFDADSGGPDYGDSVVQLNLAGGAFNIVDYFSPTDQNFLRINDLDLGSGGVTILPDQAGVPVHELVAGGKEGTIYLVDRDNMGQFDPAQDDIVQELPNAIGGEIQTVPVYWHNSVYVAGNGDYAKRFSVTNSLLSSSPVAQSSIIFASPGSPALSANGATNGILWLIKKAAPVLYALDAGNLTTLYNSSQAPSLRDKLGTMTHFASPTVANGKVYIGGNQQLTVYGLLPSLTPMAGNGQTAMDGSVLPIPLQFRAMDSYTGAPLAGISVTCKDGGVRGSFGTATMLTDSTGMASTTYTLPKKAITVTITCAATGFISAVFTETSVPGPAVRLAINSGNFQTAGTNTTLSLPFVVKVGDVNNVGVPGVVVTFSDNGAGGTLQPITATTNSSGLASTTYTTPNTAATVSVRASSTGLNSVKFTVTVQ